MCRNTSSTIGHYFTTGATHTVVETTTAPADVDVFSVSVLPGPACDGDADGVFDTQDNCVGRANADQTDTDLDGMGDVCDRDDDDDGCSDRVDPAPTDGHVVIGSRLLINCPESHEDVYGWAGDDLDGDGLASCADTDDDGDRIPDETDDCPAHHADLGPLACEFPPETCPLQFWWEVCTAGACNELLVRFTSLVNPDPTQVLFEEIDIVGQSLVLSPQEGLSLDQMRSVLVGERLDETAFVLEVWTRGRSGEPEALIATIGAYDAREVRLLEGTGNALVLAFDERGALSTIQQMSH